MHEGVKTSIAVSASSRRGCSSEFISPTHIRTEGRATVWGSEFTTKVAPRGDSTDFSPRLNVNFWVLRGGGGAWCVVRGAW